MSLKENIRQGHGFREVCCLVQEFINRKRVPDQLMGARAPNHVNIQSIFLIPRTKHKQVLKSVIE